MDVVLENSSGSAVLVIECKRVQDTSWILLTNRAPQPPGPRLRRLAKAWRMSQAGHFVLNDWSDVAIDPATEESSFCVVRGEDPKSKPMLERIAAETVSATEAVAQEERVYLDSRPGLNRDYFAAIVTTAKLSVCAFDAKDVSLADGKVPEASFTDANFVRFRKQLSYRQPTAQSLASLLGSDSERLAKAKERTVFIIQSEKLGDFLWAFNGGDTDH